MTVFLSFSKTFFYSLNKILSVCCGPGGYLLAILSFHNNTQQYILSLWILEDSFSCILEYNLEISSSSSSSSLKNSIITSNNIRTTPLQQNNSSSSSFSNHNHNYFNSFHVVWHPSGNYLYVIIHGIIYLLQLKVFNQDNQEVSIIEFISKLNENNDGNGDVKYTTKIIHKQKFEELEITSIIPIQNGDFCLLGCKKSNTIIYSTWNFDSIYYFSSNLTNFSLSILNPISLSFFHGQQTSSDMDSTFHGLDTLTQQSSTSFYLTQSINQFGYLFGFTSDYSIFCLKYSTNNNANNNNNNQNNDKNTNSLLSLPSILISSLIQPNLTIDSKLIKFNVFQVHSFDTINSNGSIVSNIICLTFYETLVENNHQINQTNKNNNNNNNNNKQSLSLQPQEEYILISNESSHQQKVITVEILIFQLNLINDLNIGNHELESSSQLEQPSLRLSTISRTSFAKNVHLSNNNSNNNDNDKNISSILSNASIETLKFNYDELFPQFIVSFGERIVSYKIDFQSINQQSSSSISSISDLLIVQFIVDTRQAGIISNPRLQNHQNYQYSHSIRTIVVSNQLITTCSNEIIENINITQNKSNNNQKNNNQKSQNTVDDSFDYDYEDISHQLVDVSGTVIHVTSLLTTISNSLKYSSDLTGGLFNSSEGNILIFNSQNFMSTEDLSLCSLQSPFNFQPITKKFQKKKQKLSNKTQYQQVFYTNSGGISLFPSQGKLSYTICKIPRSLKFDLMINSCGWKSINTTNYNSNTNSNTNKNKNNRILPDSYFQSINNTSQIGNGLILARENIGGIYFVCTLDKYTFESTYNKNDNSFDNSNNNSNNNSNVSYPIWLHSLQTGKWKLIQPNIYPASIQSIIMLPWKLYQNKFSQSNNNDNYNHNNSHNHNNHNNHNSHNYYSYSNLQNGPRTKKQYFNGKCKLLSIDRIKWFGNHTIVLCTSRGHSISNNNNNNNDDHQRKKTDTNNNQSIIGSHMCIELMTRKTVDPIIIKQSTHDIKDIPVETRRISFPHLQCIIPLPIDFIPLQIDIIPTKKHIESHKNNNSINLSQHSELNELSNHNNNNNSNNNNGSSTHNIDHDYEEEVFQLRKSINRSQSGHTNSLFPNNNNNKEKLDSNTLDEIESQDSCYLLIGSNTRYITLHITATTHMLEEEIDSIINNNNQSTRRRKYSNSTNFQDFVSFFPSSYRIEVLWDIDLRNITIYSPTYVPMEIKYPIQNALITNIEKSILPIINEDSIHSSSIGRKDNNNNTNNNNSNNNNIIGFCDVNLVLLDYEGKVANINLYNIDSINFTYDSNATFINLGKCTSINRLQHYLFPITKFSPLPLRDIYIITCQSKNLDELYDILWLPYGICYNSGPSNGGVILSSTKRNINSTLLTKPNDYLMSYLSYESIFYLKGLSLLPTSNIDPLSTFSSLTPSLSLLNSFIPLIMLLSFLNTNTTLSLSNNYNLTNISTNSNNLSNNMTIKQKNSHSYSLIELTLLNFNVLNEFLIPQYTYHTTTANYIKYLLSYLSLNPIPLQRLTEGFEVLLKNIINKSKFTRYDPEFALLISVLFASDDIFFIEVLSRLSRKLEPHISASLYPLPNYQLNLNRSNNNNHNNHSNVNNVNNVGKIKYRGILIHDSPWDQLTLFELCLSRCSLQHSSRFLTSACEQLGGSQTLESVTASLILSHELLLECFRHLHLECAIECLEFCTRLDVMAAELLHNESIKIDSTTPVQVVVQRVGEQLIYGLSYLSPVIGSDLHHLVEDTIKPHNSRTYSGINLYSFPIYKDSLTNLHYHSNTFLKINSENITTSLNNNNSNSDNSNNHENKNHENIKGISILKSQYIYSAFSVWNYYHTQLLSDNKNLKSLESISRSTSLSTSQSNIELQSSITDILKYSYSSISLKVITANLLCNKQLISCGTVMSVINYQLSTSSSCTTMWLNQALFSFETTYTHINIFSSKFPNQLVKSFIKVFDLLNFEFHSDLSLNHQQNHEIYKLLKRVLAEYELRRKCEVEMYVSNSEHHSNNGCLISMLSYSNQNHNYHHHHSNSHSQHENEHQHQHNQNQPTNTNTNVNVNVNTNINQNEYARYTSTPLHGRASSQFTIPTLSNGKLITISQLMKGIATVSLIHQQFELLLFIVILYSNKKLLVTCLLYIQQIYLFKELSSSSSSHNILSIQELSVHINHNLSQLKDFCLDHEIISNSDRIGQNNLLDETNNINNVVDLNSPVTLNENSKKFLKWISNKKVKTMNEINNEIEKYIKYYNIEN